MTVATDLRLAALVGTSVLIVAGCAGSAATPDPAAVPSALAPAAAPFTYDDYRTLARELRSFDPGGRVRALDWSATGLVFTRLDERYVVDLATGAIEPAPPETPPPSAGGDAPRERRVPRGRQAESVTSPDKRWKAMCVDWDVRIEPTDEHPDGAPITVTTDGHRKRRYGAASWVYGEELKQRSAMWWSPDSTRLVFYAFDERDVPDFTLVKGWTERHTSVTVEGYPKPGDPNPRAELRIFDVATQRTTPVAIPPTPTPDPWYVYGVRFTPDGDGILYSRLNRGQNELHLDLADPVTGAVRTVLTERQPTWQRYRPMFRFLADGRRFVWETERRGVRQLELRDLDGAVLATLTPEDLEVREIIRVDEDAGWLYYRAYGGDHPLHLHLHRTRLDGTGGVRLTGLGWSHTVRFSADGRHYVDEAQTAERPPRTTLHRADGALVATLAESEPTRVAALGHPPPELFSCLAADGQTTIYGWLHKPPGFDPSRRYPLVIDVYGGPTSKGVTSRYRPGHAATRFGFLVAKIDNRGTTGRGKAFAAAVYRQLGVVDLADQVAGVRELTARPYVDAERIGIHGSSYGGYLATLAILRHPDLFHVAVASAPVTDWRNYDSIYVERFMQTPAENAAGYESGSCLTYADGLRGHLLLLQGMQDDNVHPNNTFELADALQSAGRGFDLMVYPDAGHGLTRHAGELRWNYLREHLGD